MENTNESILSALVASLIKTEAAKLAKADVPQGMSAKGEITLRVPFELNKGMNYQVKPTVSMLSLAVVAKALVYSGATAGAIKSALRRAATEALLADQQVGVALTEADQRVADMITEVQADVLAKLPKQDRNGVVTVKILTPDGKPEIVSSTLNLGQGK